MVYIGMIVCLLSTVWILKADRMDYYDVYYRRFYYQWVLGIIIMIMDLF